MGLGTGSGLIVRAFSIVRGLVLATISAALLFSVLAFSATAATPVYQSSFGSFGKPTGIAVDESSGNVFVADSNENVVEIFGPEGEAPSGIANTRLEGFAFNGEPTGLAIDNSSSASAGALYVADVQNSAVKKFVFDAVSEEYELDEELSAAGGFSEPTGLTVDTKGNVWVGDYGSFSVIEFDPTGAEINRIDVSSSVAAPPSALALDAAGDLFVQAYGTFEAGGISTVYKFAANGSGEVEPGTTPTELSTSSWVTGVAVDLGSNTLNVAVTDHVVQYDAASLAQLVEFGDDKLSSAERLAINSATGAVYVADPVAGNVSLFRPPPPAPPDVVTLPAGPVTETTAVIGGTVNPNQAATTYFVEYSRRADFFEAVRIPASEDADAGAGEALVPVSRLATGLAPGTVYFFRVVAKNALGPAAIGATRSFRTLAAAGPQACPNDVFRIGASAGSPTAAPTSWSRPPIPKAPIRSSVSLGMETLPATADGNGVIFSVNGGALPGTSGPGTNDLYEALRSDSGWATHGVGPSAVQVSVQARSHGVSDAHTFSFWTTQGSGGSLPPANYVRSPDGSFRLLGDGSLADDPDAIGRWISPDGSHVIFTSRVQLEPQAPPAVGPGGQLTIHEHAVNVPVGAVYEWTPSGLSVVSLLPGNTTPPPGSTTYYRGYSADGSTVVFNVDGTMYARRGGITVPIVTTASAGGVTFEGVSRDGEKVFYLLGDFTGGELFVFDVGSQQTTPITAAGDAQMVNVSADGSHVYFVSDQALPGTDGVEGANNLYGWTEGDTQLVAELAAADQKLWRPGWAETVGAAQQGGITTGPIVEPSRTTPDGSVLVFESHAGLTSYDSQGNNEIYRYDEDDQNLVCVSCNPTGAPPTNSPDETLLATDSAASPTAASTRIANMTDDGSAVFFMSSDPLVVQDTDGLRDVYEWKQGRVSLISYGHSATREWLYGMTPDGHDVFFTSNEGLTPQKGAGTAAIYDARVGGGFPAPRPRHPLPGGQLPGTSGRAASLAGHRQLALRRPAQQAPVQEEAPGEEVRTPSQARAPKAPQAARLERGRQDDPGGPPMSWFATLRTTLLCGLALLAPAVFVPSAQAAASDYGIESVSASRSTSQAGAHPDFTTTIEIKTDPATPTAGDGSKEPYAATRDLSVALPAGMTGNPQAVDQCTRVQFSTAVTSGECPRASQIGITVLRLGFSHPIVEPVYSLQAPGGDSVAQIGFWAYNVPVVLDVTLRSDGDYGLTASGSGFQSQPKLASATTTIWGVPADHSHDTERQTALEVLNSAGEVNSSPPRASGMAPLAFLTNPSRCGGPQEVVFSVDSYPNAGSFLSASAPLPPVTGCELLEFTPGIDLQPTSKEADSPSGMDVSLGIDQTNIAEPNGQAPAELRKTVVTLPAGMSVNPAAAKGLGGCSEAQVGLISEDPIRFRRGPSACPDSSKVGTARILTPVLDEPIEGSLYVARQGENPFHSLLAGYLVAQGGGATIKLAGRFDLDPVTGQITATFDENPQQPFSDVSLHFKGGESGVLVTPPQCGTYAIESTLVPWSAADPGDPTAVEAVHRTSTFDVTSGADGGPCPNPPGFTPSFEAGTVTPLAGTYSPLIVKAARPDGSEVMKGIDLDLPPGLLGKLAGIPYCPASALAAAADGSGAAELASPSCPAASRIGSVTVGVGAGSDPFQVQGSAYLTGPYKGAPLSVAVVTPAVAGPFDLGAVLVRTALRVDPATAEIHAIPDPIPTILQGIPLHVRSVVLNADRRRFTLNPTSCDPMSFAGMLFGTSAARAVADRFQVGGCAGLGFAPKLSFSLSGASRRGAYPALRAVLKARAGEANIKRASVSLPHSEFLAQEHIKTICTRVQYAADACPRGSIYGHARAFTPLLDRPLEGPVYLRSSSNPLPDLVAALHGQIDIDLAGRIDSVNQGIRTVFSTVPDAPVTKFVLRMKGGKKGLLVNSRDICAAPARARAQLLGQNGKLSRTRPLLRSRCGPRSR